MSAYSMVVSIWTARPLDLAERDQLAARLELAATERDEVTEAAVEDFTEDVP